jgi:hypothetical protein
VAEALGREWIGTEMDEKSCELIKKNMTSRKYGLKPATEPKKGLVDLSQHNIEIRG